jgi:hypothetical protein
VERGHRKCFTQSFGLARSMTFFFARSLNRESYFVVPQLVFERAQLGIVVNQHVFDTGHFGEVFQYSAVRFWL